MHDGWIVIAALLVFLMQAGFLLVEAGTVRVKNSVNVAQKNVSDMILGIICYSLVGFSLMYGVSYAGFFGMGGIKSTLQDQTRWTELLIFNLAFCSVVATIVSGAVAERMRIEAYLISTAAIALLIYPVFGHWVWGNTIITSNQAFLANMGFVDHAGGVVIHVLAAFYALTAVLVLGPRQGRFDAAGNALPISGQSPVLAMTGVLILFVTWIPFNTGALELGSQQFSDVALITVLGGCAGGLAGKIIGYRLENKTFLPEYSMNGILGGLVAITCGTLFIGPLGAVALGFLGGATAIYGNHILLHKFKIDDPVGVIGVHGIAGVVGALAFPLFAVNPLPAGNAISQIAIQGFGVLLCIAWATGFGFIIFAGLKTLNTLRVSDAEEHLGLDIGVHIPNVSKADLEAGHEAAKKASELAPQNKAYSATHSAGSEIGLALSAMSEENKRLSEEAVKRSGMFTEAVESLTDGVMIYDENQVIIEVNSAYKRIMESAKVMCDVGMTRTEYIQAAMDVGLVSTDNVTAEQYVKEQLENPNSDAALQSKFSVADNHYIRRTRTTPTGGHIVLSLIHI